jgi:hypothetical protein
VYRSRNGRSTVIRWYPNASFGKIFTLSDSSKAPYSSVIASICSSEICLRFSPRLLRIFVHDSRASTSCTLPRRCSLLRFVTTQK